MGMYYFVLSLYSLEEDAREISIIILCCLLCEMSIYFRYMMMSGRPRLYAKFLKDFDVSIEQQRIETREEAALEDLSTISQQRKQAKHIKNHYFAFDALKTPSYFRRKLPVSSPKKKEDPPKKKFFEDKPKPSTKYSLNDSICSDGPNSFEEQTKYIEKKMTQTKENIEMKSSCNSLKSSKDAHEREAMSRLWGQITISDTLELGQDFYSLAFYGFYLEDDEEDLGRNIEKVKKQIAGSELGLRRSKTYISRNSISSDTSDDDDVGKRDLTASFTAQTKKEFLLNMKRKWRDERNMKNFYKIELIFGFQTILYCCLLYAIVLGPLFSEEDAQTETEFPFVIFLIKYICSIVLHMTMQPKIGSAIERLYFVKKHPHKFDRITIPLVICFFKFIVELGTEFVSLALIAACADCSDVVMNYIALGVIAELDQVYYAAIKSSLKEQFEQME